MSRKNLIWFWAAGAILNFGVGAWADNAAYTGTGGALSAGTTVGQDIAIQAVPLSGLNATASLTCPIASYGAGASPLTWNCARGSVSITSTDGSIAVAGSFTTGSMTLSGSGGGKGGHVTYWYEFAGQFTGTVTAGGVTEAVEGSIAASAKTTAQIGSGSAPLSGFSMGWSSAYGPLVVVDVANVRLLGADNIGGANLVAYGGPGSGAGQFTAIGGLAHDSSGRIYVTDSALNRIVRIDDLAGKNWIALGDTGSGNLQFSSPGGVVIDGQGKIWVADAGNNRIVRFDDMTGANWTAFGASGSGADQFSAPAAIAFDPQGRIYVADAGNNRLVRFDDLTGANWTTLTEINIDPYGYLLTGVNSVSVLPNGKIYAATPSGWLYRFDDMTGANGEPSRWQPSIAGISADAAGTVLVSGGFTPGLAVTLDALGTGSFTGSLGQSSLQPGPVLSMAATSPPAAPVLSVAALTFGRRNVGEPGITQTLTVTNIGGQPLTVSSATAGADFQVSNGCMSPLAAGANCAIGLRFDPAAAGARADILKIESNGVHPLLEAALSGVGTAPKVSLFPGSLGFLTQRVSIASGAESLTLTNPGSGPLSIASIAATGDFSETNNCPKLLPAGSGCTISVAFTPTAAGMRTGSLVVTDDAVASGAQQTAGLSGKGSAAAPSLTLTPESLLFPSQRIKAASAAQTVTLKNGSAASVALSAPVFPPGFTGSTNCGKKLAASASCSIQVQFAPAATGEITGELTVPVGGQPAIAVSLAGTAVSGGQRPQLSPNPPSVEFGAISLGDSSSQTITIRNSSGLPAGLRSLVFKGSPELARTGGNCPAILAGGASCTVTITLTPSTSESAYSGTLTIIEDSGAATRVAITGSAESNSGN